MTWDRNYGNREGDFWIEHAVQEIMNTYGDSVRPKAKSLYKFGKNLDLDAAAPETVWEHGGDEVYVTTNSIDTLSSSSTSDTAVTVRIEGHTVSGTGTDSQFTFVVQDASVNGQNKVTLTTPLARVSRVYVTSTTQAVGDVLVYEDTTIVGGVPSDDTKVHIGIYASTHGDNQSFKAATTFSNTDYFLLTSLILSVGKKTAATVDFSVEMRSPGGIFLPAFQTTLSDSSNSFQYDAKPIFIVPKNYDIRIEAATSTNNTEVDALFMGIICEVAD